MALHSAIARTLVLCAGAAVLSSCATRPVTEGVTGLYSYWIAQAARCEIRDALIDLIVEGVRERQPDLAAYLARRDTHEKAYLEESSRFEGFLAKGIHGVKDPEVRSAILLYSQTLIAYEFDFNITHTNKAGGGMDLLSTVTRGTVSVGMGAGFEGERNTARNFKLIDLFGDILVSPPTIRECNTIRGTSKGKRSPNGAYPMAGSLNLREILDTFISLTQSANLVGNFVDKRDVPTFSETMKFTTIVSAGIDPVLELKPLGRRLEVKGADASFSVRRQDIHKLTLTFTLPPQGTTVTRKRNLQFEATLDELERQRIREIDAQTEEIRRRLLGF